MTREEAIIIARENWVKENTGWSESIIDTLSALGILKLDEPKTIEQRLDAAVRENLYTESAYSRDAVYINPGYLMAIIARAGLRIVEK